MEIVSLNDDLDEFQCHDKCQNQTGDGDNHVHGEVPDHVVDAAVPCGGSLSDLRGDVRNFIVHGYQEEGAITTRFDMRVKNKVDRFNLLLSVISALGLTDKQQDTIKEINERLVSPFHK